LSIENSDLSATDFDKSRALHQAGSDPDTCASCPKQTGDDVVREQQNIGSNRIASDQQPPGQTLLQRVIAIAEARLGDLNQ